jgi:hypothetical protein
MREEGQGVQAPGGERDSTAGAKPKFKILSVNGPWLHADPPIAAGRACRPARDARDAAPRSRDMRSQRLTQLTAMITKTFFLA